MKAWGRGEGIWELERAAPQASQGYVIFRFRWVLNPVVKYIILQALQVLQTVPVSATLSSRKGSPHHWEQGRWVTRAHWPCGSKVWTAWPLQMMCTLRDGQGHCTLCMIPEKTEDPEINALLGITCLLLIFHVGGNNHLSFVVKSTGHPTNTRTAQVTLSRPLLAT